MYVALLHCTLNRKDILTLSGIMGYDMAADEAYIESYRNLVWVP